MKKITFIIIIVALSIPFLQEKFKLFSFKKLEGVIIEAKHPSFSIHDWFDGTFQQQFEKYYSENYGCRNLFIRSFNQIDYSLFNIPHAYIIVGKKGYLYEEDYVTEFTGQSSIGKDSMNKIMSDLGIVQQYLEDKNILTLTVLAPGKSYYYPQYIPETYKKVSASETNYKDILETAKKYDINLLDFNGWFLKLKDTTRFPLFPKQGIHWNYYGMALCADSIVKYVEAKKQIDLADVKYTLESSDKLRDTDYDLGDLMNLLFMQPYIKMTYPKFNIDNTNKKRLRILVVGDSFYWSIYNTGIFSQVFENEHYYYYCTTMYTPGKEIKGKPQDYNLLNEIKNYDVVLLIQSSANYNNPGVGFVQAFKKNIDLFVELKNNLIENIKSDSILFSLSKAYAKYHNLGYEVALNNFSDSITLARMDEISVTKIQMRNQPDWFAQILQKAKEAKIPVDEVMEKDAEWVMSQRHSNK